MQYEITLLEMFLERKKQFFCYSQYEIKIYRWLKIIESNCSFIRLSYIFVEYKTLASGPWD